MALKRTCFLYGQCTVTLIHSFWEGIRRQRMPIDVAGSIRQPLLCDFSQVLLQWQKDASVCFGPEHLYCALAGNELCLTVFWSQVELPQKQSRAGPEPGRTGWGPRAGEKSLERYDGWGKWWISLRLQPPGTSGKESSHEVCLPAQGFFLITKQNLHSSMYPLMPFLPSLTHPDNLLSRQAHF
jgi:hypothetical protein